MPVAASEYQHHEHMYCAEQINIPVTLPNILKSYAKAAIRTQPYDLLRWTSAYFRALADGEIPPVKARLEYPPHIHPLGITPHLLKALLNQYGYDKNREKCVGPTERTFTSMHVTMESLLRRWRGMALSDSSLYQILMTGRLLQLPEALRQCDLYRFLAIACGLLGNNLLETMIYVCELLTHEPEGGSAMIPLKTFMKLYEYLADLDCSGSQSIIETRPHDLIKGNEASLLPSSASSFDAAHFNFSANISSREMEIRGRTHDISAEDTDTEESLCHFEVTSCIKYEEELATGDTAGMSCQPSKTSDSKEMEVGESARRRWNDLSRSSLASTKPISKTETTRMLKLESRMPSEKNTYNDKKKRSERELEEGIVGELGGSASIEVTKVQEERRRRRDVVMHSSTEKVRPMDAETTAELLDSSHSSPSAGSSSSSSSLSLGKSHVDPSEPFKAATGERHQPTDKILVTRSLKLREEVEGAEDARKVSPSAVENITTEGSITARNGNVDRSNADKNMSKKNRDESFKQPKEKIKRNEDFQVEIPRDSFEYDDPTSNGNQVIRDKKSSWRQREESKDLSEQEKRIENEVGDSMDYIGDESSDENGNEAGLYSEDERVENMAEYQPIGLENILQGMCECLEPTKETRDPTIAVSAPPAPPLDLVLEFIEGTRAKSPAGPYIQPEVPGIGPPVSPTRVTDVGLWLNDCARRQQGYVAPRNLRHFLCPNLDENTRYEDYYRTKNMCP